MLTDCWHSKEERDSRRIRKELMLLRPRMPSDEKIPLQPRNQVEIDYRAALPVR